MKKEISTEQWQNLPPILKFNYELVEKDKSRVTDRYFEPTYINMSYQLKKC